MWSLTSGKDSNARQHEVTPQHLSQEVKWGASGLRSCTLAPVIRVTVSICLRLEQVKLGCAGLFLEQPLKERELTN